MLLLLLLLSAALVVAQTSALPSGGQTQSGQDSAKQSEAQPQSDLADAARQAREERERQRMKRSANSEALNDMATELSESSDQAASAPGGYRYYSFKQGDYSVLVPADAEVEQRNWYGLKLLSSELMGSRTVVILGDPIPAQGATTNEIMLNAAREYFIGCEAGVPSAGTGINTTVKPVNGHPAATVALGMCPLHDEVLGLVQLVLGDGYVMPIVCGYPLTSEDLHPSPNRPLATVVKTYDRENNGRRACDVILPSLRFREHGSRWHPKAANTATKQAVVTSALLNSNPALGAGSADDGTLGSVARMHKKASSSKVLTDLKHAAPGFSSYSFKYCSKDDCFDASLQIPVKARKNEQFQVAYTGLFEFEVPVGDTAAVIQATKGAPSESPLATRAQFIQSKINWWISYEPAVNFSGAGKAEIFNEELTTLSDMPARLATFRSPTTIQPVVTQLAAYMAPGVFVQIRCSVPEKVYADAQDMCQHVVRSLEVPLPKQDVADDPDPDAVPTPDDNHR